MEQQLIPYAALILDMLNIQDGQRLVIRGETVHLDLLTALSKEAYTRGAKHVDVRMMNQRFIRTRLEESKEDYLDYVPDEFLPGFMTPVDDNAAFLSIATMENPRELEHVSAERFSRMSKAIAVTRKPFSRAIMQSRCPWIVVAAPTSGWAKQVTGSSNPGELWKLLKPILLLDTDNPGQLWKKKCECLEKRSKLLNSLELQSLHFSGTGTDLTVGLSELARWRGGRDTTRQGQIFLPNLPTEEVFTAPDWRLTEGRAVASRAFLLMGKIVEGAEFEFKNGRIKYYSAKKGKEVLDVFFAMEESTTALGELALVDSRSPIAMSNTLFFNTLLDENSGVHFAFGSAYETCLEGGVDMDDAAKRSVGFNISRHHEDITIGTPEMNVVARSRDGSKHEIMKDGTFVID